MEYRKVLLYHSFAKSEGKKLKKYPLLDLLAANLELKLDQVSGFVAEYKLQKHHNKIVTSYFKLLKIKSNQKKIARLLDPEIFNDDTLKRGILSITLDFNSVEDRFNCMNKWICLAIEETKFNKTNAIRKELEIDTQLITRFHNLLDANEEELTIELATKRSLFGRAYAATFPSRQ